jgi:hypothetical protein
MPDYKKDWMKKADINYFAQFMTLWLAFNSWYRSHYSEITLNDREHINTLKTDYTGRNLIYKRFEYLMEEDKTKEKMKFKSDFEALSSKIYTGAKSIDIKFSPVSIHSLILECFSSRTSMICCYHVINL